MEATRENWGSRIGFLLAAAGSAVGLGNIWRFPYMAGSNGGSAFIIIYLAFTFTIGLCIMIAELTVGRRAKLAAVGAYKHTSDRWTFAGALGVLSGFLIMGFYPVVGGWALAYVWKSTTGLLADPGAIGAAFGGFITSPVQPVAWMLAFLVLNVVIVAKGIAGGIEKAGKILMPSLFVMLALLGIRSITLPGAGAGLAFLFRPDFSAVTGTTFLAALGQSFFSLSLGMGCMITYGSYLKKSEKIPSNGLIIVSLDTGVALLAGLAIFPALFAFGLEPAAGPGLVFVVVPSVFAQMGGIGVVLSIIFFVALTVAALTSSVSLFEVVVAYLIDQKQIPRARAVIGSGVVMAIMGALASLSLGVMSGTPIPLLGVGAFDLFDILTDKIFLAIGGLLLAVFVGWVIRKEDLQAELTNDGAHAFGGFTLWYNAVKYVIPVAIAVVAVVGIISIEQTALMLLGLLVIAGFALFSRRF
jgi:neurotransmitter:Na+ symporter, NSS family